MTSAAEDARIAAIRDRILDVPDFPKPGILFKDLSHVLGHGPTFRAVTELFAESLGDEKIDAVAGIEARGFVLGAALALHLGVGFVAIRKPGKLPRDKHSESYALEYGTDSLEIHRDVFEHGSRVVLVDDVLATGGTARAAGKLIERAGGTLVRQLFLLELAFLSGAERIGASPHTSLIRLA
jgi:adenine phosphoribosyltransferase